ncbi:hypothetical protein CERZMDRAFT_100156 [Cercospora zeae-maydis SCOH1-5]|uniref:Prolyl 4-hydroxylase alpha subunit Fe(2+) 2OG dioxygenase domain-containing protein n=1 Tax=Cercospora zeae-maydis SCOH1-5 TaxID=717836 RepID=A0A6A6F881_9PEZI|nr:hypothetical protein CERZMDRAFT_100156 [Cercospora zeae-maydis SCOH1-5]
MAEAVEVLQQGQSDNVGNSDSEVDCKLLSNSWKLKGNLLNALEKIQPSGSFASFGTIGQQFVDPTVSTIDGEPPIQLPVDEDAAKRLIAASHQAPFGRGSETLIDQSVRRTWELNRDQFRLCNPAYNAMLNHVLGKVRTELGIPQGTSIQAHAYKLLIYEQGAMFRPHTDTEKVPGMFGTLVVCLPSAHEGGDLVLTHRRSTKRFATSKEQPSYACWYSDVQHEVQEVTSGYRIVLTYNLVQIENPVPNLSALGTAQDFSDLKRALKYWSASKTGPVLHILEHKYTDVSLRLSAMKGADRSRVMALQQFAEKYKYNLFLGSMEHERTGSTGDDFDPHYRDNWYQDSEEEESSDDGGYHVIDEVCDQKTVLKRVVVPDEAGTQILTDVYVNEDVLLWDEAFTGEREPDEHEYEGYTGNAGAQATHWYRDTVVILVPAERMIPWCLGNFRSNQYNRGNKGNILPLLKWLRARCDQQSSAEHKAQAKADLNQVCLNVTQQNAIIRERSVKYPSIPMQLAFPADVLAEVVDILAWLENYDALVAAVADSGGQLPSTAFNTLAPLISDHFERLAPALTKAFDQFDSVHSTFECLKTLFDGELNGRAGPVGEWIANTIKRAIGIVKEPQSQDGAAVAEIVVCFKGLSGTSELIQRRTGHTNFMLAFLAGLIRKGHEVFSPAEMLSIVNRFLGPFFDGFLPTVQPISDHKRMKTDNHAAATTPKPRSNTAPAFDMVELLRYLLANDMRAELQSFFTAIDRVLMAGTPDVVARILMRSLKIAEPLAKDNMANKHTPSFQNLYRGVFETCIKTHVQKQPPEFPNWARNRVHCNCATCWDLNLFLTSITQQTARFPLSKPQRHHLHSLLDMSPATDCTHVTERHTRPETLVVTKRNRAAGVYDAWYARCESVAKMLRAFDQDLLRKLLGNRYEKIVGMRAVIHSREGRIPKEVLLKKEEEAAAAAGPCSRAAGTKKRKMIEVVDLVSD